MATTSPYFVASAKRSATVLSSVRNLRSKSKEKRKVEMKFDEVQEQFKKEKLNNCDEENITGASSDIVSAKSNNHEHSTWQPKDWQVLLNNIKEMRKDKTAVVDTQGCERTADMSEKPEVIRYQILISLMLSSQTKDQMTFAAMERLKEFGLTVPNIIKTSEKEIGKLIYPVGFWQRKAKFILQASHICHEKYNDDIPNSVKELVLLPGVGEKMAYICMNAAWGIVDGIGVDVHVHRIANRLKWVKKPTKTPENTRKELESWMPRSEWKDLNVLLVGFGQQTCFARSPKCNECLNKSVCPASSWKPKPSN